MKSLVFLCSVTLAGFVLGVAGQNCTTQDQINFVLGLPGGIVCGLNFQTANNTPTTEAGRAALDSICTAECAGAVSDWLLNTCNQPAEAQGLVLWCLPVEDAEITRCRFAFEFLDPTLFNNTDVISCGAFAQTGMCLPTCANGLTRIRTEINCCYQSIYNNSAALDGFLASGDITMDDRMFFTLLGTPELWNACNVAIPVECGDPFPAASQATTMAMMTTDGATRPSVFGSLIGATLLLAYSM